MKTALPEASRRKFTSCVNFITPINAQDHFGLACTIAKKFNKSKFGIKDSEVYSDALFGLADAVRGYKIQHGQFKYFASTCITNRILEGIRNRRRKQTIAYIDPSDMDRMHEQPPEITESIDIIFKDAPGESEEDRRNKQILSMRYLQNMSWTEIGQKFNFTKAGARYCAQSAMVKIKKRFPNLI